MRTWPHRMFRRNQELASTGLATVRFALLRPPGATGPGTPSWIAKDAFALAGVAASLRSPGPEVGGEMGVQTSSERTRRSPLPPGGSQEHNVAMWIPVLFLIAILVTYWQLTLSGLVIWALVAWVRHVAADTTPSYPRKPVQTRLVTKPMQTLPQPKPVQTRPEPKSTPARAMPAPEYLPRWTANRRLDTGREHAQWQKMFDGVAQQDPARPGPIKG